MGKNRYGYGGSVYQSFFLIYLYNIEFLFYLVIWSKCLRNNEAGVGSKQHHHFLSPSLYIQQGGGQLIKEAGDALFYP